MFAALEIVDFTIITLIVILFAGGAAASGSFRGRDRNRMRRIEEKLDLVLKSLGQTYQQPDRPRWQELALDPSKKIEAIKVYREETGAGLKEAKDAVEAFIEGRPETV